MTLCRRHGCIVILSALGVCAHVEHRHPLRSHADVDGHMEQNASGPSGGWMINVLQCLEEDTFHCFKSFVDENQDGTIKVDECFNALQQHVRDNALGNEQEFQGLVEYCLLLLVVKAWCFVFAVLGMYAIPKANKAGAAVCLLGFFAYILVVTTLQHAHVDIGYFTVLASEVKLTKHVIFLMECIITPLTHGVEELVGRGSRKTVVFGRVAVVLAASLLPVWLLLALAVALTSGLVLLLPGPWLADAVLIFAAAVAAAAGCFWFLLDDKELEPPDLSRGTAAWVASLTSAKQDNSGLRRRNSIMNFIETSEKSLKNVRSGYIHCVRMAGSLACLLPLLLAVGNSHRKVLADKPTLRDVPVDPLLPAVALVGLLARRCAVEVFKWLHLADCRASARNALNDLSPESRNLLPRVLLGVPMLYSWHSVLETSTDGEEGLMEIGAVILCILSLQLHASFYAWAADELVVVVDCFSHRSVASRGLVTVTANAAAAGNGLLAGIFGTDPKAFYDIKKEVLGEGAFGKVMLASKKGKPNMVVALKQIKKSNIPNLSTFQNEVEIQRRMDNPYIVRQQETFEDDKYVYLAMECCHGGEMFDLIIKEGKFSEQDAATLMNQMLRAIAYMHSVKVAHRDLKPDNFLMLQKDKPIADNWVKLTDFGLSKCFTPGVLMNTKAGTMFYVAPEVFANNGYSETCDVWSLGVILFILLCGEPPFSGSNDDEIMESASRGIDSHCDKLNVGKNVKELMKSMCCLDAAKRLPANQALLDSWVSEPWKRSKKAILESNVFIGKIKNFSTVTNFKRAVMQVMARRVDDRDIKVLKQTFTKMDENGDGKLSLEEMMKGCEASGVMSREVAQKLFTRMDADWSGSVDFSEFIAATMDPKSFLNEGLCKEAFDAFDKDKNGTISLKEFGGMLLGWGDVSGQDDEKERELIEMFRQADSDNSGEIDFEEFMGMMSEQ